MSEPVGAAHGAYGLRLAGLDEAARFLVAAPESWTPLELVRRTSGDPPAERFGPRRTTLTSASGAAIDVDLQRGRATISAPWTMTADEVLHPYLASVASVVAHWAGHESLHGGAVVAGSGAWLVLGERGAGKSTTLATLAARGVGILSDDLVILRHEVCCAGPRAIDLREDTANALASGQRLGIVGTRERWRVALGPVEPEVRLRGFVFLEWGASRDIATIPGSDALARLVRHRAVRAAPVRHDALLELARLPALALRRRRDPDALADDLDLLLDAIGSRG